MERGQKLLKKALIYKNIGKIQLGINTSEKWLLFLKKGNVASNIQMLH